MEWEFIAPMVISVVLFLTVGGVILLRPIMKRLGALIDVIVLEKRGAPVEENRRLRETVDTMNERLSLLEERLDFTERLVGRGTGEAGGRGEGRS